MSPVACVLTSRERGSRTFFPLMRYPWSKRWTLEGTRKHLFRSSYKCLQKILSFSRGAAFPASFASNTAITKNSKKNRKRSKEKKGEEERKKEKEKKEEAGEKKTEKERSKEERKSAEERRIERERMKGRR